MTDSLPVTPRVAGVIGGMGPDATVDFMARVIAATPAQTDQDHIRMLVDHNPRVPNRHAAIAGADPGVGAALAAMARNLESAGADFLVMPCNTAHAFAEAIRDAVDIPFVSIIEVVVNALGGQPSVGVMAADGCLRAGLYQDALDSAGYTAVTWDERETADFMELVYRVKAGEREPDIASGLQKLAASLQFGGAEILVAGCTEIPLMLDPDSLALPLLCSTDLLARRTVELARDPEADFS